MYDTQVVLVQFSVLHLLVQDTQGGGILGGDDDPAGVAVNAVDKCGGKGVLGRRVIFPFSYRYRCTRAIRLSPYSPSPAWESTPAFLSSNSRFSSS